ncbi:Uncharacterised protein [Vibrio cholerae]|uniref:Uncharacterized protein n=1 Tax=Vibrio cholerae TaxID=666 RepID=A0A655VIY8_VIBCL|nr:Uncharacterised protein [Vibrio cholerae]
MPHWVRACAHFVTCSVNVMPHVVDAGCTVTTVVFLPFTSTRCTEILVRQCRSAPESILTTGDTLPTAGIVRHTNVDTTCRH